MVPAEILTSESQERMLAIVRPDDLEAVLALCRRWEVRATVVGTVTDGARLRILDGPGGPVLADVPAKTLEEGAPRYDRPLRRPADLDARQADDPVRLPPPADCGADLLGMLADTSWVWSQYDHQLFLNTVEGPGGDATVLRLKAPGLPSTGKGLALTVDSNSRWCDLEPRLGTALVVAEAALNLACAGARPLAVVNCLNFGNPEHPEVMWQLSEAVDGMAEACLGLSVPVVGGNVSLYNESSGRDIDPTPVVGMLGLIDRLHRRPPGLRLTAGGTVLLLGDDGRATLAGSRWAETAHGHRGGRLPELDLAAHAAVCRLVSELVDAGLFEGVHDVSDGGLAVALAEMALSSGVGLRVDGAAVADHRGLFAEGPSRVVACVAAEAVAEVAGRAAAAGVPLAELGRAGGDRLLLGRAVDLVLGDVARSWQEQIPARLLQPVGRR